MTPEVSMYLVLTIVFKMGMAAMMGYYLFKVNRWAGALFFLAAISFTHPLYTRFSDDALFMMMLYGGLYLVVQREKSQPFLIGMVVFTLLHVYFAVLQACGITDIMWIPTHNVRVEGLMGNPNGAAAAIALCIPAFFQKNLKYLLPIPILGLILIDCSGGAIGAILATTIYLFVEFKLWRVFIVAGGLIALVLFLCFVDTPVIDQRVYGWYKALVLYFKGFDLPFQKVLGVGIGNWKLFNDIAIKAGNIEPGWTRLHNTFIQGFIEMGFPFLVILTGYLTSLRKLRDPHMLAALGAIFIVCSANSVFHMNAVNGMFIVIWLSIIGKEHGRSDYRSRPRGNSDGSTP